MKLNFSDDKYTIVAKEIAKKSKNNTISDNFHSPEDAFLLLIKNVRFEDLENLCKKINYYYPDLTLKECYEMTQGLGNVFTSNPDIIKTLIYNCANECVNNRIHLGDYYTADGKINTSSWISHSINEAKLAGELASIFGLDVQRAKTMGILHDYGRKFVHNFEHVTKGFEELVNLGWISEASATLTHSFINGGRFACCDKTKEGLSISKDGEISWQKDENKDDVTCFLENYNYNLYDHILNISDLMATSERIVSPYERVQDILSRRSPDIDSKKYFLSKLVNKLIEFLQEMKVDIIYDGATPTDSLETLDSRFKVVSDAFFNTYLKMKEDNRDL